MRIAISCLVLALIGGSALAADAQLDAARRCTQITDSLQRLVCFDKAFATAGAPVVAAAPTHGDEPDGKPTAQAAAEAPGSFDARISSLQQLAFDRVRISLDNGQVWDQMDSNRLFYVKVGDTLRIKKGVLGSYRMARVSNGTSGWVDAQRQR